MTLDIFHREAVVRIAHLNGKPWKYETYKSGEHLSFAKECRDRYLAAGLPDVGFDEICKTYIDPYVP